MACLEESRNILTGTRLLCHLDTVAVASKGQFRRCSFYKRSRCLDKTRVGGAVVAARDRARDVARSAEIFPETLGRATGSAGVQK